MNKSSSTPPSDRWDKFSNDELSVINECIQNWRMEDLGLGEFTLNLLKELANVIEARAGIIHVNQ